MSRAKAEGKAKAEKKRNGNVEGKYTSEEIDLGKRRGMWKGSGEGGKNEPTKDAKQAVVEGQGEDKSTRKGKEKRGNEGEKNRQGTGVEEGKTKKEGGLGFQQGPRRGGGEEGEKVKIENEKQAVVGGKGKHQRNDTTKETEPLLSVTKANKTGARVRAMRKTCDFCKSKKVRKGRKHGAGEFLFYARHRYILLMASIT